MCEPHKSKDEWHKCEKGGKFLTELKWREQDKLEKVTKYECVYEK